MLPKASRILIAAATMASSAAFAADCVNGWNTATCTVPAGVTSIAVSLVGGGGGGAYGSGGAGGGGGGGGFCGVTLAVTPGSTIAVPYGAFSGLGGAGGTSGPSFTAGAPGIPAEIQYGGTSYWAGGGRGGGEFGTNATPGFGASFNCVGGNGASGSAGSANVGGAGGSNIGGRGGNGGNLNQNGGNGTSGGITLSFTAAAAESIPTLSEWAMIFMASLMAMLAYARLRRR